MHQKHLATQILGQLATAPYLTLLKDEPPGIIWTTVLKASEQDRTRLSKGQPLSRAYYAGKSAHKDHIPKSNGPLLLPTNRYMLVLAPAVCCDRRMSSPVQIRKSDKLLPVSG